MDQSIGYQVLIDLYNCNYEKMEDLKYVKNMMKELSEILETTVKKVAFHKFKPYGISGVLIIAESHLTIHTWPEYRYVGIDLFTCTKKVNAEKAIKFLCSKLETNDYVIKEIKRGTEKK